MIELPKEIIRRKELSKRVISTLVKWPTTENVEESYKKCCVYITGSLARYELDENSDLDLFVVDHFEPDNPESALTFVEQSRIVSSLEDIRNDSLFAKRKFSRGGYFLQPLPFSAMVDEIGDPQDDARNLFTARMLLLINSYPMINKVGYGRLRKEATDAYWTLVDSKGCASTAPGDMPYKPIMFLNDLKRWWLSVALNFERNHNHRAIARKMELCKAQGIFDPLEDPRAERRLANLKLRHARVLAVYSVLANMLACEHSEGIIRSDFEDIIQSSPIERLIYIAQHRPNFERDVSRLLAMYATYLEFLTGSKAELASRIKDDKQYKPVKFQAYDFHSGLFNLMNRLGEKSLLYQYMVV